MATRFCQRIGQIQVQQDSTSPSQKAEGCGDEDGPSGRHLSLGASGMEVCFAHPGPPTISKGRRPMRTTIQAVAEAMQNERIALDASVSKKI
jgi:hypothetical protein